MHHKKGNRDDNRPDNLEMLPNQRAHMIVHPYERREAAGVQHLFPVEESLDAAFQSESERN